MRIERLQLTNFRCFENEGLQFHPYTNLIYGDNASGKTSLLEALFVITRANSFRAKSLSDLVNKQTTEFILHVGLTGQHHSLGMKHSQKHTLVRLDKQNVKRLSSVAQRFPVSVFHTESTRLITDSPQQRRSFLNWGTFHVKHGFGKSWSDFSKVLKQRNALLRQRKFDQLAFWNDQFISLAKSVNLDQKAYVDLLFPELEKLLKDFLPDLDFELGFKEGFDAELDQQSLLEKYHDREQERRQTLFGPQRADIKFGVDGADAKDVISRGQTKLVAMALFLANLQVWLKHSDDDVWVLVDDLGAELDQRNCEIVLEKLRNEKVQLFFTSVEKHDWLESWFNSGKVFHVKHAQVKCVL